MLTPATLGQAHKLLALLSEAGATTEQVQNLLENGDLLRQMLLTDLSKVDREAFKTLLMPSINWTPVDQYGAKLRDWNQQFKLGLTKRQIDALVTKLPVHAGLLQPTSVTLTTGKGLQHDWSLAMQILEYELHQIGVAFPAYVDGSRLTYYAGCEAASDQRRLAPALLDLERFWDKQNGVSVRQVRGQLRGQPLPTTEVAWLLAFNPQVYAAMDGKTIPRLWALGLVVDSENVPYFDRDAGEAFVHANWDVNQWDVCSVAAFR